MDKVAVVILNYNGKKFLEKFLPSLVKESRSSQLFVADNASTDTSITFLKKVFPDIKLIQLEKNFGFAGGYNEALKQVNAEYYAIINSDVEVTPNWLAPLVCFLDSHAHYAAVQPKINSYPNKTLFDYAGASGGFIDAMGYPYCRGRIFQHIEKDTGQYDDAVDVDWTSGACMLIRSKIFQAFDGFDESFFAHMEEIDLCWRIRSSGMKLACLPESAVYHVGGGTLARSSPVKTYLNFRNGLSLLAKNLPMGQLIWKLLFRLMLDCLAAFKLACESSPGHLMAILKAHLYFYWRLPSTLKKRTTLSSPGSIWLWKEYFMNGKKTFGKIQG